MPLHMRRFAVFFFFSGFCSLAYEVIWLRLGMASFGVTTPIVSLFLSVFMGGLGFGSWAAGRWVRRFERSLVPLRLYALTELLIGVSAVVVPLELVAARGFVEHYGADLSLSSLQYYGIAAFLIVIILLPWSTLMGATFPLAMAAIRSFNATEQTSFSFLYLANVVGATAGSLIPAFVLIEIIGFHGTLKLAALCNFLVAALALVLSLRAQVFDAAPAHPTPKSLTAPATLSARAILGLLFLTGLVSLALEVVWIREFTPYMGNEVYTFAWILGCYLLGTYAGSHLYRRWLRSHAPGESSAAWLLLGIVSLAPLLMADPRYVMMGFLRVAFAVTPLTALLGFVTPQLVDHYSSGDPDRAGKAYAINVVGCILGPLLAGFLLLPQFGERWSLVLLALPFFGLLLVFKPSARSGKLHYGLRFYAETAAVALALAIFTQDYTIAFHPRIIRRDYTATVLATGDGMNKQLVVNGINLTLLTPITKYMAHMPLAFLNRPPKNALVICFGMGTTHRSLLTWNIPVTAVELLPSVPGMYGYYHPDGPELLRSPNSHLVIDDGRLFLEKTKQQFDVITIDPPPPISAAGVSFLYSRQFYDVLKPRLAPDGILQQWVSGLDKQEFIAIAKALRVSFPYVRSLVAISYNGTTGVHFLASRRPIPQLTAAELARRLPPAAQTDFVEWTPQWTPEQAFQVVLSQEVPLDPVLQQFPNVQPLDDDRPINEYYLLRKNLPPRWSAALTAMIASSH